MRLPQSTSISRFVDTRNDVLKEPTASGDVLHVRPHADIHVAESVSHTLRHLATYLAMIVSDAAALFVALAVAVTACGVGNGFDPYLMYFVSAFVMLASFAMLGLYPGIGLTPAVEIRQTSTVVCIMMTAFAAATVLHARDAWVLLPIGFVWMTLLVALPVLRGVMRSMLARTNWWGASTVIFGSGETGVSIYESLRANPTWGLRPIGIVDDSIRSEGAAQAYLGRASEVEGLVREFGVTWCVVAMPDRPRDEILKLVDDYAGMIPHTLVVPDLAGLPSLWTGAADCGGYPGLQLKERLLMPVPRVVKRCVDVTLTLIVIVVLAPFLVLLAAIVKLTSPGPIFYAQQRLGLHGKPFRAWKFRTMVPDADAILEKYLQEHEELRLEWERDHKLRKDPRVTLVGQFLRKTSLDELPQVWNVLLGEMSLVGPRPIVQAEVDRYGDCYGLYLRVLPGITGLWQVSGRNNTTYEERVQLDSYYVRNWSPWLDFCILLSTVRVVLLREGAF
ncbi:undecaprenyl-phosphate galactose phosphotransferase WbaP [Aporhodopirellula aestuarii]|uniref:Undecaprenyl-phosphate galactose phosphotransferase WbaP n=1 Tax=Aporhodopirellula aestuarii TaxID=2950107 RepID=A0ABT0U295_9BACT|nr:undecaprenyl-phosphate galactose phosphotransferase WbaP [Aporhodopirellula aestuarii]MCM2370997.1 undecaprenyl-phosphate galactose phosphotransferase WbaP [Aporhodopirellula aestuarii]